MATITKHNVTLNTADYGTGILRSSSNHVSDLLTAESDWEASVVPSVVGTNGIDIDITLTNNGAARACPTLRFNAGFTRADRTDGRLWQWLADGGAIARLDAASGTSTWGGLSPAESLYGASIKWPVLGAEVEEDTINPNPHKVLVLMFTTMGYMHELAGTFDSTGGDNQPTNKAEFYIRGNRKQADSGDSGFFASTGVNNLTIKMGSPPTGDSSTTIRSNDQLRNWTLTVTSGAADNDVRQITASVPNAVPSTNSMTVTLDTDLSSAVSVNDTFTIADRNWRALDWWAADETRTWKICLRLLDITGKTDAQIRTLIAEAMSTYVSYFNTKYPSRIHSRKIHGRIYQYNMAQTNYTDGGGSNPRRYASFTPDAFTDGEPRATRITSSGSIFTAPYIAAHRANYDERGEHDTTWYEYLDKTVNVQALRDNGFAAILMWHVAGQHGRLDLPPGAVSHMPDGLRGSLSEISQWGRDNGLLVFLYAGYAYEFVNTGDFEEHVTFDPNDPATPTAYAHTDAGLVHDDNFSLSPAPASKFDVSLEKLAVLRENLQDVLEHIDGIGLDAAAAVEKDGWVSAEYARYRDWLPQKQVFAEGQHPGESHAYVKICLSPSQSSSFTVRDPIMEALFPGYQFFAFCDRSQYGSDEDWHAQVSLIESSGGIPIMTSIPSVESQIPQPQNTRFANPAADPLSGNTFPGTRASPGVYTSGL